MYALILAFYHLRYPFFLLDSWCFDWYRIWTFCPGPICMVFYILLDFDTHLFPWIREIFFWFPFGEYLCAFDLALFSFLYSTIHKFGLFTLSQSSYMFHSWSCFLQLSDPVLTCLQYLIFSLPFHPIYWWSFPLNFLLSSWIFHFQFYFILPFLWRFSSLNSILIYWIVFIISLNFWVQSWAIQY